MDLLYRIREEAGNAAQADRLGLREPERRETASLLLAGMLSPRKSAETVTKAS